MLKPNFPGMENIKADEGLLFINMLKNDGCTASEITDFLTGIDECLTIQKSASIVDRFKGKKKHNKSSAKDLIYERASRIELSQFSVNKL